MLTLLKIILLTYSIPKSDSIIGKYYHHVQTCAYSYAIDYKYELELNPKNYFLLTKLVFDSRFQKTKKELTRRTWSLKNNTITFKMLSATNKLTDCSKEIVFTFSNNKLNRLSLYSLDDFPSEMITRND